MKKFKLYAEIPSASGATTQLRWDKISGFDWIIDYNKLALHMAQQNQLISAGVKYQIFKVELEDDIFNSLLLEIGRKQRNILRDFIIVSEGTFPLVQIIRKSVMSKVE